MISILSKVLFSHSGRLDFPPHVFTPSCLPNHSVFPELANSPPSVMLDDDTFALSFVQHITY